MKKGKSLNRIFLISMISFFALSGILGASFFLLGVFGVIQGKILLTTTVLGAFSLLGLVSSKNLEEKDYKKIMGVIALITSVLASILVLGFIWDFVDITATTGRVALIVGIISFSIAHATLMFGKARKKTTKMSMYATLTLIFIVTLMLIYLVLNKNITNIGSVFYRFLGFTVVLDVMGTIITPLLRKLNE